MKVVFKKLLRVFKSKIVLVPVIAVALLATGAGVAALTTRDQSTNNANQQSQSESSYFGKRGTSLNSGSDTLGQSTTTDTSTDSTSSTNESTTTKPTTKKQTTKTTVKVSCNTQQKTIFTVQYNSAINTENALHLTNQGMPDYTTDPKPEDDRHTSKLNSISQTYQNQLISIHC